MAEDPEDKGINERQRIQRIEELTVGRQPADFSEILKMSGVYFHIFPHCFDFRHSVAHFEMS
jgi:hypothetical protein